MIDTPDLPQDPSSDPTQVMDPEKKNRTITVRPWNVMLHNDDVNTMEHVVKSLRESVSGMSEQEAVLITMEAHEQGVALVITCALEKAELIRDRIQTFSLSATIEQS